MYKHTPVESYRIVTVVYKSVEQSFPSVSIQEIFEYICTQRRSAQ